MSRLHSRDYQAVEGRGQGGGRTLGRTAGGVTRIHPVILPWLRRRTYMGDKRPTWDLGNGAVVPAIPARNRAGATVSLLGRMCDLPESPETDKSRNSVIRLSRLSPGPVSRDRIRISTAIKIYPSLTHHSYLIWIGRL